MNEDTFENARWLIGAIARGLHARIGEGVTEVLNRMAEQSFAATAFVAAEPCPLPVVRHLPACVGEAMLLDADVAAALAAIADDLQWRHSEGYSDAVLGEGFMESHGWCQIVGPHGFFPGDDFLLGLLLLGPDLHYKDHYHPAPELYWPLTGASEWKQGAGAYETRQAGDIIWHVPWKMHATATTDKPLLAVWSWTRDTAISTKIAGT